MSLIPNAYAGTSAAQASNQGAASMLPMIIVIVMIVLLYGWMWYQHNRKNKNHQQMIDNLQKGDDLATTGGLLGKVAKIDDNHIVLQVSSETEVYIQKSAVATVLPKGTVKFNK